TARRALDFEPDNAAAIHAIAHVLEMCGRAREGIAWLESTRKTWAASAGFANHLAWHLTLFHIELGATDTAVAIYDQTLAPRPTSPTTALVDASALLWRLPLRGVGLCAPLRAPARRARGEPP